VDIHNIRSTILLENDGLHDEAHEYKALARAAMTVLKRVGPTAPQCDQLFINYAKDFIVPYLHSEDVALTTALRTVVPSDVALLRLNRNAATEAIKAARSDPSKKDESPSKLPRVDASGTTPASTGKRIKFNRKTMLLSWGQPPFPTGATGPVELTCAYCKKPVTAKTKGFNWLRNHYRACPESSKWHN
jgi:hypothetical protein